MLQMTRSVAELYPGYTGGMSPMAAGFAMCTWRSAQDLLGATVDGINAPSISMQWYTTEGAHGVHQQQGAVLMTQLAQARQILVHPCAALALAQEQNCWLVLRHRLLQSLVGEGCGGWSLQIDDIGCKAPSAAVSQALQLSALPNSSPGRSRLYAWYIVPARMKKM